MKDIFTCYICGKEGFRHQVQTIKSLGIRACRKHKTQFIRYQKFLDNIPRTQNDPNEIVINKHTAEIILYDKSSLECARTIIDVEDIEKIKNIRWCLSPSNKPNAYCQGIVNKKSVRLHRFILQDKIDDSVEVDHKDRNPLNNVKSNLRICSHQENKYNNRIQENNKIGVVGVYFDKSRNKWVAQLHKQRKHIFLGRFKDIEDAIIARLNGEKLYFGEFAPQQHLYEQYGIK